MAEVYGGIAVYTPEGVHPRALVDDRAGFYGRVVVDAFAVVEAHAALYGGVRVQAHAVVGRVPVRGLTDRDPGSPQVASIGPDTVIGCGAVVYAGAVIGAKCLIGDGASVREGCLIGEGVLLGRHVTVNYEATIGAGTRVMDGAHVTGRAVIGQHCFIGPLVVMANDPDPLRPYVPERIRGPHIGDNVLIGAGAVILPGVRIGDRARIGAGAIVARDVPDGATVLSPPARAVPSVGSHVELG